MTDLAEVYRQEAERRRQVAVESEEREAIQTEDLPEPQLETLVTGWPGPLGQDAYHGLVGEIVRTVEPHTEADPAALLLQLLVAVGSAIGNGPFFRTEADRQAANLYVVLVGETSRGRKGSSWGHIRRLLSSADEEWTRHHISTGLSSGEGLICEVRDAIEKEEPVKEKGRVVDYQTVIEDHGVSDKRLLVVQTEFASTLRVLRREGNTLSAVMREAWDTGNLGIITKNSPARATGAHISIIGHVTRGELLRHLDDTEAGNGFGNRFLWACARRSKLLPEGGSVEQQKLARLGERLRDVLAFAREVEEVTRDEEARALWRKIYPDLSRDVPGLLGSLTARAEAQVVRLSLMYALLDRSRVIGAEHLKAALAVWGYAEDSAKFVFGRAIGDPAADTILRELRNRPEGLTRTEISGLFSRNRSGREIDRALETLAELELAEVREESTRGRRIERWVAR